MTIQQLIDRLIETGDEAYRNQATVKVVGVNDEEDLDEFNVKDGVNCVELRTELDQGYDDDDDEGEWLDNEDDDPEIWEDDDLDLAEDDDDIDEEDDGEDYEDGDAESDKES